MKISLKNLSKGLDSQRRSVYTINIVKDSQSQKNKAINIPIRRKLLMKCQKCGMNEANINMMMQMNNEKMQLHVCNSCFEEIKDQVNNQNFFQGGGDMFANPFQQYAAGGQGQSRTRTRQKQGNIEDGVRDQRGTSVTDNARNGNIEPVIGRDDEVKRVTETVKRRIENNPVLIGQPGVGQTAIAE